MPVPKRKTSKSRRDSRHSCNFIRPRPFSACSNCQQPVLGHVVCAGCGYYKGRQIMATKVDRAVKRHEMRTAAQQNSPEAPSEA